MTARQPSQPSLPHDTAFPRHYLRIRILDAPLRMSTGAQPAEPLPYQWSCHVEAEGGLIDQFGFLDTRGFDPRPELVESLLAVIARTQNTRRRQLTHALVRYGDRQLFDLVQAFAEHMGGHPDPRAPSLMLN